MKKEYFMGIDIGSNSGKGVLLNPDLKVIAECSVGHEMKNPMPSYYEHDADEDWWGDFCRISRNLIEKSGIAAEQIACVGLSALGADCLPVDENCNPLRPAILYGIDARADREILELQERFQGKPGHERMMRFTSSDIAPKIYWIKKHEPDVYAKTYKFLTGSSFLTAKLTGNFVVDRYLGPSCFGPLYDQETLEAMKGFEEICRPDQLARVMEAEEIAGYVTADAAAETGLCAGTPVLTGTDDSGAEAISVGVVKPGYLMVQMGSSLYSILGVDRLLDDDVFYSEEFIVSGLYTLSGGTNAAGSLTKWYRDVIYSDLQEQGERDRYEIMMDGLEDIPAGSDALITLPYFAGERVPVNDPHACGILFGLRLSHTKKHMYKSALESAAYSIAQQIALMEKHKEAVIDTICVVGGGAKNPIWVQIVADVTGRTIYVPKITAGASYGDALMAAMAVGHRGMKSYSELAGYIEYEKAYEPDMKRYVQYQKFQSIYNTLYESTKKEAHLLHELWGECMLQ